MHFNLSFWQYSRNWVRSINPFNGKRPRSFAAVLLIEGSDERHGESLVAKHVRVLFSLFLISVAGVPAHSSTKIGLAGNSEFFALTESESKNFLIQSDSFTSRMTEFDRQIRSRNLTLTSESEFLSFASQSAMAWSDSDLALLTSFVADYRHASEQF